MFCKKTNAFSYSPTPCPAGCWKLHRNCTISHLPSKPSRRVRGRRGGSPLRAAAPGLRKGCCQLLSYSLWECQGTWHALVTGTVNTQSTRCIREAARINRHFFNNIWTTLCKLQRKYFYSFYPIPLVSKHKNFLSYLQTWYERIKKNNQYHSRNTQTRYSKPCKHMLNLKRCCLVLLIPGRPAYIIKTTNSWCPKLAPTEVRERNTPLFLTA